MKRICILFTIILCTVFLGCGSSGNNSKTDPTGSSYVSQNCDIPNIRGYVATSYMIDSKLYAGVYMKDMEVEDGRYSVVIYDILEEKTDRVILDGPEQMIMCTINGFNGEGYKALFCSYDENKNYTKILLDSFDCNGKMISNLDITRVLSDNVLGVQITDFYINRTGDLYFYVNNYDIDKGGSSSCVFCYDNSGELKLIKEYSNNVSGISELVSGVCIGEEVNANMSGVRSYSIHELNNENKDIGELSLESYYGITDSTQDTKKIVFDGTNVYEYDIVSEEQNFLFSYEDVGVKSGMLNSGNFYAAESGEFYVINVVGEDEDGLRKFDWLKISKSNNSTEKKIITIAVAEPDGILTEAVSDFNKNNKEYKIVVKVYKPETDGSYSEVLLADIAAGNIPDIIALDAMELDVMVDKGLAYDLSEFLESDKELSRTDFIGRSIELYSREEHIYALPSCLSVSALSGKERLLHGREGWTLDEFEEYIHSLSEEKSATMGISKEAMMRIMIEQDIANFVDWEKKTCSFDSEEFKKLLQFANMYQEEMIPEYSSVDFVEMMWSDEVVLFPSLIMDCYGYQSAKNLWGEEVAYIGYPSPDRNGIFVSDNGKGYVITVQSAYKEEMWQLIKKVVMSSELAESGLPAYKPLFEKACGQAMEKKIEVTSDGKEVEQPKIEFEYGGMEFDIYAASEEDIAMIKGLINRAQPIHSGSIKIENIIIEEAGAFFHGQKNLDEVAAIIQSRVSIYINE